jgi:serine/threonine protein kinase
MEVMPFLRIALGIARAVSHFHARGLIHRDIKPANLMVNLTTGDAWLTGFGLTMRLPSTRQISDSPEVAVGTLAYMAPEQTLRIDRSVDSRSDLYSLGVTLYQLLVGALPFTAGDPMEWMHCHIARVPVAPKVRLNEIPEPISAIIMKLLAKNAEERYQTASGLEADLRRGLTAMEKLGKIDPFRLAAHDVSRRLMIPERLYGREAQMKTLLATFDRVLARGRSELVLVSGYSGVGKSSFVNQTAQRTGAFHWSLRCRQIRSIPAGHSLRYGSSRLPESYPPVAGKRRRGVNPLAGSFAKRAGAGRPANGWAHP